MNKLLAYSITAIISLFSFPHLAHADRDGWDGHHRHRYEREYGHYRPYNRDSVVVIGQAYPDYYATPTYYAVPSYSYVPVAPAPVAATPQPVYSADESDDYCREFTRNISIDGRRQKAYGTACREPDGSWQIQNN